MKAIKYILFILMTYIGLVCHGQEVRLNLQECIDAAQCCLLKGSHMALR